MFPHILLERAVLDTIGRRQELLGPLKDDVVIPVAIGLADQLSAYQDVRPSAKFSVGEVRLRVGKVRTFILAELYDRGKPIRLKEAMRSWNIEIVSSRAEDFVATNIGRRFRFLDHNLGMMTKLWHGVCDRLVEYYARRPGATFRNRGLPRFIEDCVGSYLLLDIDERQAIEQGETTSDYRVE